MPVVPASRVTALSGEGAFEVLRAARLLEDAGRHVVHLEIGEPDWATPPHVVEAAVRALLLVAASAKTISSASCKCLSGLCA